QEVAAGAYDIGITSYPDLVSNFKRIGAPVGFAYIRPIFSRFSALGLVKKGKHKAAGKLLMRFLLSKEGQEMYRDSGRMPARLDVKPLDPRLTENVVFTPLKPEWVPLYRPYAEFIQKTFLGRP
ncbi:MAG: substrate-binding domain-containing protein, partial [Candidatus Binatia bacterium]